MKSEVIKVESGGAHRHAVDRAVEVIRRGGVVAFPTETVYGVGVRADQPDALARLREVKNRPVRQAFTVHVDSLKTALRYVPDASGLTTRLMRRGWPGPLTLLLPVSATGLDHIRTAWGADAAEAVCVNETVGLRCPDDAMAIELLRRVDAPVVAASANLAGEPAPYSGEAVVARLSGSVDLILDAGTTRYARSSTIVRVAGSTYDFVREGVYDKGIVKRLATLRLLLVCTGNTCRSPMAAGVTMRLMAERLKCEVSELPDRGVVVTSAGMSGGGGGPAEYAVTVMAKRGVDISSHSPQTLTEAMVRDADHVFAMTGWHRDRIVSMVPDAADRVALVVDNCDVDDPIGGSEQAYDECARIIEDGLRARLREISV